LFDDAALAQATAAIDALADRTGLALTVVFVDDFSGMHPTDWANATAQSSGRTQPADVLLAIATTARGFGVSVDPGIGLSDAQLSAAENADLLPRLQQNDWAGAVEAYARALGDLRTGDDTGSAAIRGDTGGGSTAWILPTVTTVLLVVLGGAFLVAYLRGRRRNG
ncbi:MAG: TPM domain-containing protein, partial [Microbacteriaceae bacterium]|nr:TPM domain-containing protein [Microbacteriaceae bacterium]